MGRLDRVRFEDEGHPVVVTRCWPDLRHGRYPVDRDLFDGRPLETATLEEVRERLGEPA